MPRVEINGRVVEFEKPPTPEDIDHAAAAMRATSTTTTPTTTPREPTFAETLPAAVGQGAAATAATPLGPVARTAAGMVGAAGGEMLEIAKQRAEHEPQGFAPILPRVGKAAGGALAGDVVVGGLKKGLQAAQGLGRMLIGPAARSTLSQAIAERIPVGLKDVLPSLRAVPGTSARAAVEQSARVGTRLGEEIDALGGPIEAGHFARRAQNAMRATLRQAEQALVGVDPKDVKGVLQADPGFASMYQLVGSTLDTARITHALTQNPEHLARVLHQVGPAAIDDMRRAWLTWVLEGATGRGGIRAGLIDGQAAAGAWRDLGAAQEILFTNLKPGLDDLFGVLEHTHISSTFGAKATTGNAMLEGFKQVAKIALPGVLGGELGYRQRGLGGAVGGAGVGLLTPYLVGRVLVSPGGIELLTGIAQASHDPGLFRQLLPSLVQMATPILSQALGRQAVPAAGQQLGGLLAPRSAGASVGPFTLAAPPPTEPTPRTLQRPQYRTTPLGAP